MLHGEQTLRAWRLAHFLGQHSVQAPAILHNGLRIRREALFSLGPSPVNVGRVCVCLCVCVFILTCTCPCETDVMFQSHALASMRAAVGVGTQKILGKVHMAQLEIGGSFLPTSLSILEDQGMECLLGLDMLKRHRMYVRATHECKSMVRFPLHIKMRDVAYTHPDARPRTHTLPLPLSIPCAN